MSTYLNVRKTYYSVSKEAFRAMGRKDEKSIETASVKTVICQPNMLFELIVSRYTLSLRLHPKSIYILNKRPLFLELEYPVQKVCGNCI